MHKNYQKRFYNPNHIYFITTNVKSGFPFFKDDQICNILINTIKINKNIKEFKLFGFVIITNHTHLLINATITNNISEVMRSIKTNSSREINRYLKYNEGRVARPDLHERFDIPRFKWQERFYDHVIRNDNDYYNHIEYIYQNPLKHLRMENYEDFKYSSCKFWQDLIDNYD